MTIKNGLDKIRIFSKKLTLIKISGIQAALLIIIASLSIALAATNVDKTPRTIEGKKEVEQEDQLVDVAEEAVSEQAAKIDEVVIEKIDAESEYEDNSESIPQVDNTAQIKEICRQKSEALLGASRGAGWNDEVSAPLAELARLTCEQKALNPATKYESPDDKLKKIERKIDDLTWEVEKSN